MKRGKFRPAVFLVTYAFDKNKIYYLVLRRKLHWTGWEFPKGGKRFFETSKNAVRREVREETRLKILKINKHNFSGKYLYQKELKNRPGIIGQTFSLFSVEVEKKKPKLSKIEHSNFKWLSYDKAKKILTWKNQKKSLEIVEGFLKDKN